MRNYHRQREASKLDPAHYCKGCEGKESHPSKNIALGVIRSMLYQAYDGHRPDKYGGWTQEQYIAYTKALTAYKCKFCRSWHLGHDSRKGATR